MLFRPFLRYLVEDYTDTPSWSQQLFGQLNMMVDTLNRLLRKGIDWSNVNSEVQVVSCTSNVAVQVNLQTMTIQPATVIAQYSGGQVASAIITGYAGVLQPIVTVTNATNPIGVQLVNLLFLP